jgi:hypothetical protein
MQEKRKEAESFLGWRFEGKVSEKEKFCIYDCRKASETFPQRERERGLFFSLSSFVIVVVPAGNGWKPRKQKGYCSME